ncbi:interleukin-17 receptor D [Osmerus mordax]|uniref:interleukin-17 receptor D n=1 Tax=Osmerus mordax TaxID=8014 RepID=UPI00350EDABF
MWRTTIIYCHVLTLTSQLVRPQVNMPLLAPGNCSLECVRQGSPGCEYCRISRQDVETSLGMRSLEQFGSCVPWPCKSLLGDEDDACQHYVEAPRDLTVDFLPDQDPKHDTIMVSWRPSPYGISFLRGFQVLLQVLGGTRSSCQLLLLSSRTSLSPSYAHRVYRSDPFPGLVLGAQYVVTVLALPVPEQWDRFYQSKTFSTRSCPEKMGLDQCRRDWYPRHIEVLQQGCDVTVTFNLAPPNLDIHHYFSLCYGEGLNRYTAIIPSPGNRTHHSYQIQGLQGGHNYTCEIAADEVDSVRKAFSIEVLHIQTDPSSLATASGSPALLLPVGLALSAIFVVLLSVLIRRRSRLWMKALDMARPDTTQQHPDQSGSPEEIISPEEVTSLTSSRSTPPRLLICYSSRDGPAHVRAVMHLGAFLQQHMATQVCLDLWDSLSVAEEGRVGWLSRRLQESDYVLVLCSRGMKTHTPPWEEGEESSSSLAVALIAEELGRTRAKGHDLSKYMAAMFEYSAERDVPAALGLLSAYRLPRDLPLLFSRLHRLALHRPGAALMLPGLSEEGYALLPAGAALRNTILEAGLESNDFLEVGLEQWADRGGGATAPHTETV